MKILQQKWADLVAKANQLVQQNMTKRPTRTKPRGTTLRDFAFPHEETNLRKLIDSTMRLYNTDLIDTKKVKEQTSPPIYAMCAHRISLPLVFSTACSVRLDRLRVLCLTRCDLSNVDTFRAIDPLPGLEWLNLSHNSLSYLDCSEHTFPRLVHLDVSFNCFEQFDHLGGPYRTLQRLDMRSNLLTSIDRLDQRTRMPQLQFVDLRDNLFTRSTSIWLANHASHCVRQISLGENQITQIDSSLVAAHLFSHLDLSGNLLDTV
ncbi:unnamed protein product [Echinostoma caproni]|uniref:Leucine-rich repeat-containing protein 51 n=1 Tax=Echinostoma caproni TaxID=27848 RepID=A0A183A896_9TREM|nr:unnamed protein product [Echinostoma caproni]